MIELPFVLAMALNRLAGCGVKTRFEAPDRLPSLRGSRLLEL